MPLPAQSVRKYNAGIYFPYPAGHLDSTKAFCFGKINYISDSTDLSLEYIPVVGKLLDQLGGICQQSLYDGKFANSKEDRLYYIFFNASLIGYLQDGRIIVERLIDSLPFPRLKQKFISVSGIEGVECELENDDGFYQTAGAVHNSRLYVVPRIGTKTSDNKCLGFIDVYNLSPFKYDYSISFANPECRNIRYLSITDRYIYIINNKDHLSVYEK